MRRHVLDPSLAEHPDLSAVAAQRFAVVRAGPHRSSPCLTFLARPVPCPGSPGYARRMLPQVSALLRIAPITHRAGHASSRARIERTRAATSPQTVGGAILAGMISAVSGSGRGMLAQIGRAALVPWWTAQLLTGTKSFERNLVIGSH